VTELRDLADDSGYTCDWGNCDDVAVAERATNDSLEPWLPVCERHSGAHDTGCVRCPDSGQPPAGAS
jgi:hypothetical protein